MSKLSPRRWPKAVAVDYVRLSNSPSTRKDSVLVLCKLSFLLFTMKYLTTFLSLVLMSMAFARDFRPASHLENIPAYNSSIQECYVFETAPGVAYTVEVSNNLSNWTPQDEIYGLGGEYAVAMREFTPPPPPPPGTPPANPPTLATNVSLRLQPASGTAGGVVVAWRSLDHDGPMIVRIAAEIDPGWNQIPIFWNRFADYNFYFWHPGVAVAPPAVNSPLGPKDSAMLAVLEASVPAINQQIAASILHSRNAPPPAPPDPDSKRFWRVKVDSSLDTDQDGSPDWAEFEIVARGTGSMVPGVIGDAFNSDTNGDGIPDGQQLDTDGDGTPDAFDPDPNDNTAFYPLGPIPRYALFPIQDTTGAGASQPYEVLQINDKSRVLYRKATWIAGVWTPLAPPSNGSSGMQLLAGAYAINDNDVIIGKGRYELRADPEYLTNLLYFWSSPQAVPLPVKQNADINQAYAGDFVYPYLSANDPTRKTFLSNDGIFTGVTRKWTADADGNFSEKDVHYSTWTLPTGAGSLSTKGPVSQEMQFHKSPGLSWNFKPDFTPNGKVFIPAALPDLPFQPLQVFATPQGTLAFPESDTAGSPKLFTQGAWKDAPLYQHATDMSDDGIAIGRSHDNLIAPILLNGKWTGITRSAPGLTGIWTDSNVRLSNTTASGWILAQHSPVATDKAAVLLPIRIIESPPDPSFLEATGVDAYSIKSEDSGPAVSNKIWIMAPSGSGSTKVQLKSPLNDKTPLELSADGIKFDDGPNITLAADNRKFDITASSSSNSGMEIPLTIKLGTVETVSRPIGVKVMKRRTIKVSVHPVGSLVEGKTTNEPDTVPTKAQLDEFLNKVYTPQINAVFDTTIVPLRNLEWDKATPADFGAADPNNYISVGNGWLDTNGGDQYNEDTYIRDQLNDATADINIYILGGGRIRTVLTWDNTIRTVKSIVLGMTRVKENTIFIDGDIGWYHGLIGNDTGMEQLRTIAHEIGHCLVGEGHADTGDSAVKLKGFNPTNLVQERLMVSGNLTRKPVAGFRLVKGEWDEAEKWMKKRLNGDN